MVDVLFTHSYFLSFDPKEYKAMMPYPPLGTMYAASITRQHGYTAAFFDSMLASSELEIDKAIQLHRPKVLVIYDDDFNYLTKMCLSRMREAAFVMATVARKAGCTVVVHGSDPVDHLEKYFEHDADYAICGEGEETLIELLHLLLRNQGVREEIRGLAYLNDGVVQRNPPREVLHELDALPIPAWELIDVGKYRALWNKHHGYFSVNAVTTRGCPFHCNWCAKPLYGQVYNSRSPENVVEEMKILKAVVQPDHIWFCDDIFGLKPGWLKAFSEIVRKNDALIPFKCLSRADLLLKDDAIFHLQKSGCRSVWIGAESGSQKILDAMEKGTTVQQIYEATRKLKRAGIRVGFFLQYGYPGENLEDIGLTLKMLKECKPDEIGISVSYPLPGTKFYATVRKQLGEKQNWFDSQDLDLMFSGTFLPDFYRTLHRITHKKFRIWQGLDILRHTVIRPWKISWQRLRAILAVAFHLITLPKFEAELKRLATQPSSGVAAC